MYFPSVNHREISATFSEVDKRIAALERRINAGEGLPLPETVEEAMGHIKTLIIAYIKDVGEKDVPDPSRDILEVWKVLVKGDPTWNAIRDNCRELVYCRNCINMNRLDALPAIAEKMAVRTLRHIYLYMKTRCIREGRLED